jgi:Cu2+-exporting ATPase
MIADVAKPDFESKQSASAKEKVEVSCTHCGLPVPLGLVDSARDEQFCCSGCLGAYELIHSTGLDSFYGMTDRAGAKSVSDDRNGFLEFDEPIFQSKYATETNASESKIDLVVDGIHCGACIWLIEKLPMLQSGVLSTTVNWARRTVTVHWQRDQVALSRIASTLNRIGYRPSPVQPNQTRNRWKAENRKHLIGIGIAAACAGNNMIISAALYLGMFSHMSAGMTGLMRIASGVVGIVALCSPGRIFLKSAVTAIRTRTPHMDLPIALGLSVGTIAGLVNVIRGTGEIYFDSLSVLIFLLLIGRWIQFRQQSKATDAVEMLYRLTPQMARKIVDGTATEILVDLVEIGDRLEVLPGDLFPVDGEIVEGATRVDESILTGESEACRRGEGDLVAAGTKNEASAVTIKALAVGNETRLSQIVGLVEQASSQKPQIVQWANQVGGYFVAVVLVLSLITFCWWAAVDVETAIDRTIALLIVACPCALALATPLAIAVSLGRAAKHRIMIKGGDVLQGLQKPGMIWLDKTGTLTEGRLQVVSWSGDKHWIHYVEKLESKSSHPIARAILEYADSNPVAVPGGVSISNSESFGGQGVGGTVGPHRLLIGNETLMNRFGIEIYSSQRRMAQRQIEAGFSPCWVAADGEIVAVIAIGDTIRDDAAESVSMLKSKGWDVGILSGDHQHVVDRVARRLGISNENSKGGIEPEGKLSVVNQSAQSGTVVMIGDGVNDSAALAAANVGIAVKGGAEASLAAAPVFFSKPGITPVIELLAVADSTSAIMKLNLYVSLAYNISFALLAFAGLINPLVAAILMPISSITVVALSLKSGHHLIVSSPIQ